MRSLPRFLATFVVAVGVVTCTDSPTSAPRPAKPGNGLRSGFALSPQFTKAAAFAAAHADDFGITFDHVHVVVTRPPAEVVKDTTVAFTPTTPDLTLDITINANFDGESFAVTMDYLTAGAPVFHGAGNVTSHPAETSGEPQVITIQYTGPGANVTHVSIAPKPASLIAPTPQTFVVSAFDANNTAVPSGPVKWTSSDASVATINSSGTTGILTPTGKRGTVTVTAVTVNGSTDNTTATVSLPASGIALVSGGGQTGKVGAALGSPGVVRVTAADGIGVQGVTVNFAPPTGGKVGSSSVVTDANGLASTTLTLGGAVGAQSFAAVALGFSVAIPASATVGDPASIAVVSGSGQKDTVRHALKAPLIVRVADKFDNGVPGVTVNWSKTGGGTLSAGTSVTANDGTASMGYTLGNTVATETITATVSGVEGGASFSEQAVASLPSSIAIVSGDAQSGRVTQPLGSSLVVKVTDDAGNGVAGFAVNWSATNGTLGSSTTTTDDAGVASNTLTLGAVTGAASATASIGAKSVTFNATVQPGIVAKIAFKVGPSTVAAGAIITPAVQVSLLDAQGNLTPATSAVTIAIGTNPGSATLGGTATRSAVAGVATFSDLSISAASNGYTLVASAVGVTSITSAAFNVTGQVAGPDTWTGAVSTDWSDPNNWSAGVPTAATNAVVPAGTPHAPALTVGSVVNDLTVASGATLSLVDFKLTASGSVTAIGSITGNASGLLSLVGSGKTVSGTLPNTSFDQSASYSMAAPTVIGVFTLNTTGGLTISSTATINQTNVVKGTFTVQNGAAITTTKLAVSGTATAIYSQTGGTVTVNGDVNFNGGSTAGLITGGVLSVTGDFLQGSQFSTQSFVASGTHKLSFINTGSSGISFATPAASTVNVIEFAGAVPISLGTALVATGALQTPPAAAATVTGNGNLLTVAGLNVDGLVLDNIMLASSGGTITKFDNVTFQNYAPTATPFTLSHPGGVSAFSFNNTKFLVTPTSGHYLSVTDANPSDGNVLTINLVNATPADGSTQTATAGGALVNWSSVGALIAWTNASGGNFNNAANWSLGRVPNASDSVVIALSGTYTVTLDIPFTAASITIGGPSGTQTFLDNTSALTVNKVILVNANGVLSVGSATVNGTAHITNNGTVKSVYGTIGLPIANTGLIIANGTTTLSGALTTTPTSIVRMLPDGTTGFSNLVVSSGFTNNGTIELTSTGSNYSSQLTVGGAVTNAAGATISSLVGTGGPRTLSATLVNAGTLTVSQPLSMIGPNAAHTNSGTIDLSASDLTLSQSGAAPSFTNSGAVTIGAGHTFAIQNGTFAQNSGTISGAGSLSLLNVTADFASDFTNAATTLALNNSTINGPGKITNATGKTLTLLYSTIGATSGLINQGTLVANGNAAVNGPLTTVVGSIIRMQGDGTTGFSNFTSATSFTNNGAIELTSIGSNYASQLNVTSGTLTNAPGATISSLVGTGGTRTIAAQLDNQGTLTVAQALTMSKSSVAYTNSGTIDATAASLTINQSGTTPSFTNTGAISIGAGQTFSVTSGTFNHSAGTIGGAGSLSFASVVANFASDFSNATTALLLNNTTVNGPGIITNAGGKTLTMLYSTIGATSGLINNGTLVANGSSGVNGSLTTGPGSIIRLQGDGSTGFSTFTVANSFTNSASIELTSIVSTYSATLQVTNGTLTNAASGTISSLPGTGGTRTLTAQLDNQGTVTISAPLQMNKTNAVSSNSGTLDVSGGDLTITQNGAAPSFTNSGNLNIGAGRTVSITNGTFNQSSGTLGGAGTLSLVSVTGNFTTNFTNATTTLLTNNSTLNGPGTITNAAGRSLTLLYSTIGSTSALINNGTLIVNGTSNVNGPFTVANGSTVTMQPDGSTGFSNLVVANGFTNNGTIQLTSTVSTYSSQLTVTAGTLVNAAGSTISILPGTGGGRTLAAQFDNQGTISIAAPLSFNKLGAANVNTGTIDINGGDFTVSQGGTTPSLTNSGTINIASGRSLIITNGTFSQNATLSGAGTLNVTSVAVNLGQPFDNTITHLVTNNSTFNGPGTLTNASGQTLTMLNSTIGATSALINNGTLIVNGTNTINGPFTSPTGSILRLQPDGSTGVSNFVTANGFTNNGGIELTSAVSGYTTELTVSSGTLTNAAGGTISSLVGTGGPRFILAEVNNQGTLTVLQPLSIIKTSAQHQNSGTIDATGSDLTITQSGTTPTFTNTGTMTVGVGHTLTVTNGTFTLQPSATLNGGGAFSMTSGTASFNTGFTLGALNLTSVTASFAAGVSTAATALNLSSVTVNGPGTITNAAGQTLTLKSTTISASSGLNNLGTVVGNGSSAITGAYTSGPGSTLRLLPDGTTGSAILTFASGFTNNGLIELTSSVAGYPSTLVVSSGTLTNPSGSTISTLPGAGGNRTIDAQLDNQGTLTLNQPLTLSHTSAAHTNSGTIDLTGADLTVNQSGTTPSFTNNGTITLPAGRTMTLTGGTITESAGATLSGGGTLSLTGTTANFNGGFSVGTLNLNTVTATFATAQTTASTVYNFSNVTVNGPGSFTNAAGQTITLKNTTFNASTAFDNQGTIISNATVTMNAPFTTGSGSILRLQGDGTTGFSTFTAASSFTNNGTIELTSATAGYPAQLSVTSGTLTNAAGATISTLPGAGGNRTIDAELNNQGTLTLTQPLTLSHTNAQHTNSGVIDATASDLTLTLNGTTHSFANNGTMTIGAGHTLTVTNGNFTQGSTATLNGGGALTLTNVTGAFNSSFTLSALTLVSGTSSFANDLSTATLALTFNGGAVINGPGVITNAAGKTLNMQNSTIGASSGLINQGTLITDASAVISGPLTTAAGSTIRIQPTGGTGFSTLTVASGFTNHGLIELTSTVSAYSAQLTISSGTLTNASDGTINTLTGTGGSRTLNGTVVNQGTMTVGVSGTQILTITGAFTNSATGVLNLDLNGLTVGTGYDRLAITGAATLGGTLNVSNLAGFTPTTGNAFTILTYGSVTGDFATYNLPSVPAAGWSHGAPSGTSFTITAN